MIQKHKLAPHLMFTAQASGFSSRQSFSFDGAEFSESNQCVFSSDWSEISFWLPDNVLCFLLHRQKNGEEFFHLIYRTQVRRRIEPRPKLFPLEGIKEN